MKARVYLEGNCEECAIPIDLEVNLHDVKDVRQSYALDCFIWVMSHLREYEKNQICEDCAHNSADDVPIWTKKLTSGVC